MTMAGEDPTGASGEPVEVEKRIAYALKCFGAQSVSPGRTPHVTPPPYVRRHIVEHAEAGGVLDAVVVPELVPWLDITSLCAAHSEDPIPLLAIARRTSYAWTSDHRRNAAALAFASAAEGLSIAGLPTAWSVPWAKAPGPSEILVAHGAGAVDIARTTTGRAYIAYACDRDVSVCDLGSRTKVRVQIESGHPTAISVVAVDAERRLILAVGDEHGSVTLWPISLDDNGRPESPDRELHLADGGGFRVTQLVGHAGPPTCFVVGRENGRISVLAADGTARPRSRQVHKGQVTGVAIDPERGRGYSVGIDGLLRAWELEGRRLDTVEQTPVGDSPRAVACARVHGESIVLAVADGQLKLWRLPLDTHQAEVVEHDVAVTAVAVPAGLGVPIAVTGDERGHLRVLRLDQEPVGPTFTGHSRGVGRLACATVAPGLMMAVSVGGDGSVRSWNSLPGALGSPVGRDDVTGIYISYRGADTARVAARLQEALASAFPENEFITGVDVIRTGGSDPGSVYEEFVRQYAVVLVVIGTSWATGMSASGGRCFDHVRLEIRAALDAGVPVVPVLVDDAPMPSEQDLPSDLAALARLSPLEISGADFDSAVDRLCAVLQRHGLNRR